ncbi:Metallo-dependent phosphatase [Daedalea quercina L-15889]|uniref:Metallo-dependent phosphatase n=1 Tax=Daedalea quercina L-15889 TaxID=1314783 RepID=A0A165T7B1_9APHY|nr:Metallo-dependent phosphatase [Daedalea quercina L-15889]
MPLPRPIVWITVVTPIIALFLVFPPPIHLIKSAAKYSIPWPLGHHVSLGSNAGHSQSIAYEQAHGLRPFTRRIVAVGDLHGDMPNAQTVLQMAGVVDANGDWSGEVDFFVQTGDIIDRGDDTIKLYAWMDKLREQAHEVDGTVLSHLGNHEWMNAIGDWRYVRSSEIATFGGVAARQRMLSSGRIGKSWTANYTITSRLPLHPSLGPPNTDYISSTSNDALSHAALSFVHGGLSATYHDLTPFPSRINDLGASLLRKIYSHPPAPPSPPNPYSGLPSDATEAERELYGGNGPLWYRGWALDSEQNVCSQVDDVLRRTGTRRMVMGHTPDFEHITSRCSGKIIIIDTGISHAYGGVLSALSIEYTLTPLSVTDPSSPSEARWLEREVVSALYPGRRDILVDEERQVQGAFTEA